MRVSGSSPWAERRELRFGTLTVTDRAKSLIYNALERGQLSCGSLVRELEEKFAQLQDVKEAVAVATGTDADALALAVLYDLGASRGDEVIIPALSFIATANAVLQAGFVPRFVDIDPRTLNLSADHIEGAITEKTRAIMPVHLMGKPAPMEEILEIAGKHGLKVIEDAAEAHGMEYRGRKAGSMGEMGAFSTYVAHIITTVEGGFVTTNDAGYAEILRSLRSHGRNCTCQNCVMNAGAAYCSKRFAREGVDDIRFTYDRVGFSCKMNELEAAIGLGNLEQYEDILDRRYRNLKCMLSRMARFKPYLYSIRETQKEKIGPHALPIIVGKESTFTRGDLLRYLADCGIDSRTLFLSIPTQSHAYAFSGHQLGDFPDAEYVGENGIHIGMHQDLSGEDLDYLTQALENFLTHEQN